MQTYTRCFGCERGGGPPDCQIRSCSREKGYVLCSNCPDLEGCKKFDWLGGPSGNIMKKLKESKGKSKRQLINEATKDMKPL